jgi:LuxR family maltose regulon positive regulatory protein
VPQLAKLTRPKLHRVVSRPRLFDRLDACRERPVTWVIGPPGAGKTSLVASYAEARNLHTLWYQVDSGDADLATFFHYLSLSVADARRQRHPLPALTPQHHADLPGFARLYFRALFSRLKTPGILVLDNYHELPEGSPLHMLFECMARELPDGLGIVVISRTPPPPACASLRALDRISLLDWEELRLTVEESRQIAEARHEIDDNTLRSVHESTGGWPVGLVLILEDMRRFGAGATQVRTEGQEVLFDYFAGQIFASLPPETRQVLMLMALLRRATAEQAMQFTQDAQAASVIDSLYKRRLFVDKRGDSFQFHDLFRAFLLQQFEKAFDDAQAREWRTRASALLAESGQVEDAFALACEARNWEAAASLVLGHAARLFEQGRVRTLLAWIDGMQPEVVAHAPWLDFWAAVALAARSPALSRARFEGSYARFLPIGDDVALTLCCGGILATSYWEFDNLAMLDPWIDRLLALLDKGIAFPTPEAELRVHAALLFALNVRRPDPMALEACISHIHALLLREGWVNARVDAAVQLLSYCCSAADFAQAGRVVALAEPWLHEPALAPVYPALWWMQVGHYRAALGDDRGATDAYGKALVQVEQNALAAPLLHVHCQFGLAWLALCRGDIEAAETARARGAAHWTSARRIDSCIDASLRGLIAARQGDAVQALACAQEHFALAASVGVASLRHGSAVQLAIAQVEAGDASAALETLQHARDAFTGTAYAPLAYQLDLAEAYALRESDPEAAHAALQRGLVGSRVDNGKFLLRLLPRVLPVLVAEALRAGIDIDYAARLARDFSLQAPGDDVPGWPWPLEIRLLGGFEIRRDGEPLAYSRKTPKKTLALLKAIVALGSAGTVAEQRLMDTLWPDEEGDAAANSLAATVLRLRTLLGDAAAIVQTGGKLRLDRTRAWVDAFAFEQAVAAADAAAHQRGTNEQHHLARALALYRGGFLVEDESEAWPVATRERLRGRFIHAVGRHAELLEANGDCEAALGAYLRGLDADAAVESFYQGLMRCYQRLGRRSEAISAYQRLRQVLSITLGLTPSASSERLYQALRAEAPAA